MFWKIAPGRQGKHGVRIGVGGLLENDLKGGVPGRGWEWTYESHHTNWEPSHRCAVNK